MILEEKYMISSFLQNPGTEHTLLNTYCFPPRPSQRECIQQRTRYETPCELQENVLRAEYRLGGFIHTYVCSLHKCFTIHNRLSIIFPNTQFFHEKKIQITCVNRFLFICLYCKLTVAVVLK